MISTCTAMEKGIQKLAITTMCHTENNEALKIFIVPSGKDIVALILGTNCSIIQIVVLKEKENLVMMYYLQINYPILLLHGVRF